MINNKKILVVIFALAFLMRLAALFSFAGEKSLLYVNDSQTYLQVAKNLIAHGTYSMEISDTPHPDNFRTPLYPFFLIPFVWSSASLYLVAIVQNVIASLGLVIFYILAKKLVPSKTALIASILAALEPFTALINSQILTEAIFTPLFLGAILFLTLFIEDNKPSKLYIATILLGLSTLTRPISSPLILLLPLAGFFVYLKNKTFPVKKLLISILLCGLVVSPWLWFTWSRLQTLSFSSINGMQLYAYHGRIFDAWRYQQDPSITDRLPDVSLDSINNTLSAAAIPPVREVGLNYIKSHWTEYLKFHFLRMPRLFTDSSYTNIINGISFLNFDFDSSAGGLLDEILYGQSAHAFLMLRAQPIVILILVADILFAIIALLSLANPIIYFFYKREWRTSRIFLVVFILLYMLVASPIGGARFRIPINPLLFMLSAESLFIIYKFNSIEKISKINK